MFDGTNNFGMKRVGHVDYQQVTDAVCIQVTRPDRHFGIKRNGKKGFFNRMCGVAVVDDVNALVNFILKNIITVHVNFSRIRNRSCCFDGNGPPVISVGINGYICLNIRRNTIKSIVYTTAKRYDCYRGNDNFHGKVLWVDTNLAMSVAADRTISFTSSGKSYDSTSLNNLIVLSQASFAAASLYRVGAVSL